MLRHSCGHALAETESTRYTQEWLGHRNIQNTVISERGFTAALLIRVTWGVFVCSTGTAG